MPDGARSWRTQKEMGSRAQDQGFAWKRRRAIGVKEYWRGKEYFFFLRNFKITVGKLCVNVSMAEKLQFVTVNKSLVVFSNYHTYTSGAGQPPSIVSVIILKMLRKVVKGTNLVIN